jgi:ATP-dependent DNA helicase DinG
MIQPSDLRLPFPDWTPGQWEIVCQVVAHLAQPNPAPVILEAPTGVGKSAIALAVAHLLKLPKTVLLTGTLQLQDQYLSTFGENPRNPEGALVTAKGRGNFPCLIDPSKTASNADCTVGLACSHKGSKSSTPTCPYFVQRDIALHAPELVTNYPFWLAQVNYAGRFKPDLLICDEAHTLEEEVRRFASVAIRKSHLTLATGGTLPDLKTISEWKSWAKNILADLKREYQEAQANKTSVSSGEHKYYSAVTGLYEACDQLISDKQADDDGWVIESQPWGVALRPVWVRGYTDKYVLKHAPKLLLMSATVLSKDVFAWTLGLPDESTFIRVPSRFPVENRPLNYSPIGKVKGGKNLAEILPTLVGAVDDILDRHPDERGLIHTVSYEIARAVAARSKHRRRLISHDSSNRAQSLDYLRYTPNAVLISPSMSTGVDLPYDLCRFQIMCKLAFPYLGDPQIKKRMKLGPDGQPSKLASAWYNWQTACTLIQTLWAWRACHRRRLCDLLTRRQLRLVEAHRQGHAAGVVHIRHRQIPGDRVESTHRHRRADPSVPNRTSCSMNFYDSSELVRKHLDNRR